MRDRDQVWCPTCDTAVEQVDVDWPSVRARCYRCELDLYLSGYLEPTTVAARERHLRPLELSPPPRLRLKKTAAPGVESFRIGGVLIGVTLRIERDAIVIKGILGREQRISHEEVIGFMALQHVAADGENIGAMALDWHVLIFTTEDTLIRLWECRDRSPAKYVASELQRTLLQVREARSPYRD